MAPMQLKDKIQQSLDEARMILPGVQALLGFQFIAVFTTGFDKLIAEQKYLHLACLACTILSSMLLMMPAAYHRLNDHGDDTEWFLRLTSVCIMLALIPLAAGITGDFSLVTYYITQSAVVSAASCAVIWLLFVMFWFGSTHLLRPAKERFEVHKLIEQVIASRKGK